MVTALAQKCCYRGIHILFWPELESTDGADRASFGYER